MSTIRISNLIYLDFRAYLTIHVYLHTLLCRQGLTYANNVLYESAGLYGQSTVRILDADTAQVRKKVTMDANLFAEGLAYANGTLIQLTWKSHRGFIYDANTLETKQEFRFSTTLNEGWGVTWDSCKNEYIVTDGSEYLHFWDPETLSEKRKVPVMRMNGSPALQMNELEFWRGRVLANVWFEDVLLVINPETGVVEKEYGES
jgi:glutaminyl-peptide cyclotransferase